MILDVFPSYKDKDMVDLLYQYERATGLSLNILVEKYLEKVLYQNDYLTANGDINDVQITLKQKHTPKCEFRKGKRANGSVQLFYGDFYYGYVKPDEFDNRVEQLSQFSYDELEQMDKNRWDSTNGAYNFFLRFRLENPHLSFEDCLANIRFKTSYIPSKNTTQIRHNGFSICTINGKYTSEFKKIMEYVVSLSDEELSALEDELSNSPTNRRKYILNKMEGK